MRHFVTNAGLKKLCRRVGLGGNNNDDMTWAYISRPGWCWGAYMCVAQKFLSIGGVGSEIVREIGLLRALCYPCQSTYGKGWQDSARKCEFIIWATRTS